MVVARDKKNRLREMEIISLQPAQSKNLLHLEKVFYVIEVIKVIRFERILKTGGFQPKGVIRNLGEYYWKIKKFLTGTSFQTHGGIY